jgi:hypothetical protein
LHPPERAIAPYLECRVGKILLGVVIGVVLVIWLLAACVSNLF